MPAFIIYNTQLYPIHKDKITIGRGLDNHLVIQETTVSRNHASIVFQDDRYWIVDHESTGGVFLNGEKVTKFALSSGDSFVLANVPLVFVENISELAKNAAKTTGSLNNKLSDSDSESVD